MITRVRNIVWIGSTYVGVSSVTYIEVSSVKGTWQSRSVGSSYRNTYNNTHGNRLGTLENNLINQKFKNTSY